MSNMNIQGLGSMQAMQGMNRPPKAQPLSDEQKSQLQDILSEYDSSSITSDQAKEFFDKIKEAGIREPEVREAVEEAGFDADQLFEMAHGQSERPGRTQSTGSQMNLEALQSMQQILSQFDLSSLSDSQEQDLWSQLSQAGLSQTGSVLNLSA